MPLRHIPPDTWAGLRGRALAILIGVIIVFWSATFRAAGAGDTNEAASVRTEPRENIRRPSALGAAEALYRRYCRRCHAADGTGGHARRRFPELPDFTRSTWHEDRTDVQLRVSILEGRGTSMPAFSGPLTERQ